MYIIFLNLLIICLFLLAVIFVVSVVLSVVESIDRKKQDKYNSSLISRGIDVTWSTPGYKNKNDE